MKSFAIFTIAASLASVFADEADVVACIFNRERAAIGVPKLFIADILMATAKDHAAHLKKVGSEPQEYKENIGIGERFKKVKYDFSDAYGITGNGYKTADRFGEAMVTSFNEYVLNPELAHIGVARNGRYWNIDMGDSYEPVKTREPICPEDMY